MDSQGEVGNLVRLEPLPIRCLPFHPAFAQADKEDVCAKLALDIS